MVPVVTGSLKVLLATKDETYYLAVEINMGLSL
jgi:hypothetical protein